MSFILKALKKLENEKTARKAAPLEISSALLAPDKGHLYSPRKKGRWAIVTLLLIACAGALYYFMHRGAAPVSETRKAVSPPVPAVPSAPPTRAVQQPAQIPAQPVQTAAPKMRPAMEMTKTSATPKTVSHLLPEKLEKKPETLRARRRAVPNPEPEPLVQPYAGSPALTVSGIAYQDNPAESMAVVNGALVKSGMSVAGVQIERIFVDRVRFRGNGGVFDVPLAR